MTSHSQTRLRWLFGLLLALALARWAVPLQQPAYDTVSATPPRARAPAPLVSDTPAETKLSPVLERPTQPVPPPVGNAFAVRLPQPAATPAPVLQAVLPQAPPPAPTALPHKPPEPTAQQLQLRVIGTWDDNEKPGVFVATPFGTVLARPGTVLLAQYRVVAHDSRLLTLEHLTTRQTLLLEIPQASDGRISNRRHLEQPR